MMKIIGLFPLALVSLGLACTAPQRPTKPYHLKSGKIIYLVNSGPLTAPNMPQEKGMVYEYQTTLSLDDVPALTQEARELWDDIHARVEQIPGITLAILQADSQPTGKFIQQNRSFRFVIKHKPDGTWDWPLDKPASSPQ